MGNPYKAYGTNKQAEIDGVWQRIYDCEIKIARFNNKEFAKEVEQKRKKNRHRLKFMSKDEQAKMMAPLVARYIIRDWKNVKDQDENDVEYSPETAEIMLNDLPDFAAEILQISMDMDNYRQEVIEESEKN